MGRYLPCNKDYENYYVGQVGRGHPVFTGARTQRGYGLGGILGGLFRSAMPLIKQGAKTLGREALRTGVGIAQDAMEGKDIKAPPCRAQSNEQGGPQRKGENITSSSTGYKKKSNRQTGHFHISQETEKIARHL